VVVMESTGVYWKSPHSALEAVGIAAWVVNARHVKAVPGRKTDVADAQVHIQPPGIRKQAPLLRQRCTPDALRNNLLEGPCF
jgi:transposase